MFTYLCRGDQVPVELRQNRGQKSQMPNITLSFTRRVLLTITALSGHMTWAAPLVLLHLLKKSDDCFISILSGSHGDKSKNDHRDSQEALARMVCFHGFPGGRTQSGQGQGLFCRSSVETCLDISVWVDVGEPASSLHYGLTGAKPTCSSDSRQRVPQADLQVGASAATVNSYDCFCWVPG